MNSSSGMTKQSYQLFKLNLAHSGHKAKTRQENKPKKEKPIFAASHWITSKSGRLQDSDLTTEMLYISCGSALRNFELEDVQDFLAAFNDLFCVMPGLSMFSSLFYSKDNLIWLPVVLLRQRFVLCLIEQHHTARKEGGRIVFPSHTGFSMSLLWKTGLLFSCSSFCCLLYLSFLSVFCSLASLISPLHLSLFLPTAPLHT